MKQKRKTVNLRLPLEQIAAIDRLAKLAGTTRTVVLNVILASAVMQRKA